MKPRHPTQVEEVLPTTFSQEILQDLAKFFDEKGHAISFYFDRANFADTSHREELLDVEHLIEHVAGASDSVAEDLEKDIATIRSLEPTIRNHPGNFRAVFACKRKKVLRYAVLPYASNMKILKLGTRFELVPLLRALDICTPYCVILAEAGKARGFTVRGDEISEAASRFSPTNISIHVEESRAKSSRRADGNNNIETREKVFLRSLANMVRDFMSEQMCRYLVVGCRKDLWSALKPELDRSHIDQPPTGHFPIQSFDAAPHEVFQSAKPVVDGLQLHRYEEFWRQVAAAPPGHSAVGPERILECLDSGRVHKLFLGSIPDGELIECPACGRSQPGMSSQCIYCAGQQLRPVSIDEFIARQALLSGVEIIAPASEEHYRAYEVGALLRY